MKVVSLNGSHANVVLRQLSWVYDSVGNKGKSVLAKYLMDYKDAIQLSGKIADMTYLYQSQKIVIFDIPRTSEEHGAHAMYTVAEKLKDGFLNSTKYIPVTKHFKPPHVIFFANFKCPDGTFSKDRIKLINLDERNDDVEHEAFAFA